MFFLLIWLSVIGATGLIARQRGLNTTGYVILAVFLGPMALMIALLSSPPPESSSGTEPRNLSLPATLQQVNEIKARLARLQHQLDHVEKNLERLNRDGAEQMVSVQPLQSGPAERPSAAGKEKQEKEAFELVVGRTWLNRIGVIFFVAGIGFFISYSFHYFSALTKIILGYVLTVSFFLWGTALERKEAYRKIGYGILGGAWGLCYLTTYALHYVPATRLIASSALDLALLAAVSLAAVLYNLKYRSWVVTSITFILAFVTFGLGGITGSSVVFWAMLISSLCWLAVRLNWSVFLVLSLSASYLVYAHWIVPRLLPPFLAFSPRAFFWDEFEILFRMLMVSWVLFSITLFVLPGQKREDRRAVLNGTLINAGCVAFLGCAELHRIRPELAWSGDPRFWFLVILAGLYFGSAALARTARKARLVVVFSAVAFSLLAMAVVLRSSPVNAVFFWIMETGILLGLGLFYHEKVYRVLSLCLGFFILLRLLAVDYYDRSIIHFAGLAVRHDLSVLAVTAVMYLVTGIVTKTPDLVKRMSPAEFSLLRCYPAVGAGLFVVLLGRQIESWWLSLAWAGWGAFLLLGGIVFRDRVVRWSALSVFLLACLRVITVDLAAVSTVYRIFAFTGLGLVCLGGSFVYTRFIHPETVPVKDWSPVKDHEHNEHTEE